MVDTGTVEQIIRDLIKETEDLKNTQFVGGDSWIFYKNHTANQWDLDFLIPADNGVLNFRVAFVPDDPTVVTAATLWTVDDEWTQAHQELILDTPGVPHSWDIHFVAHGTNFDYKAKLVIKSVHSGTIQITSI